MVTSPRVRLVTLARYHDADARGRRSVVRRLAQPNPNRFHYYQPLKAALADAFAAPTPWAAGLARASRVLRACQPIGPSHATALAHARDLLDRTAGMAPVAERLEGYLLTMIQRPEPMLLGGTRVTLGPTLVAHRVGPRVHRVGVVKLNWAIRRPSQLAGPGAEMAAAALANWAEGQVVADGARLERGCVLVADPGAGLVARPKGASVHALERLSHVMTEFDAALARFGPLAA